jgi:uncharacterized phage protein (TIGR01671 family)
MREIKFRAWGGSEKKHFVYFDLAAVQDDWYESTTQNEDGSRHIIHKTDADSIQQFTGLKDKDGKEIYEGDVVTVSDSDWLVEWDEEDAGFWLSSTSKRLQLFGTTETTRLNIGLVHDETAIVGNIYENPEFLNADIQRE